MRIIIADNYEEMSREAANVIADYIKEKPDCVLGLATGSTPIGLYAELVKDNKAGEISFKDVMTFNLDEYRGLDPKHHQSYRYFMQDNLFDHVDVVPENTHVPNGFNPDAEEACAEYEEMIAEAGGLDLQLLGLGHNGHIGFNEPTDHFPLTTN
ncbi:MAG: 6-phosphogluconolactonase, partial [Eggerthellaceae bacterium]|nr:6-phosphogluconolactonase [Eggerthellaceae bacterium]